DVELERLRLEEAEQTRRVSQAQSQAGLLGEREEGARRQAEALAAELAELAGRTDELRSRGEAATAEQAELAAVIRERQKVRAELQERAAALGRELAAAGQGLDSKRAHLVDLARRQASARNQLGQVQGRQRSLAATQQRLETERAELGAEQERAAALLA